MSTSILHIETRHRRGGAERNLSHFATWQVAAGYRVGLAFGPDSLVEEVPAGVEGIQIPSLIRRPNPGADVGAIRDLRARIGRQGFAVVHTHQSKAGVVGRVAARGRARLVMHTVHMISFGAGYGRLSSAAFRRAEIVCAGWTDELIAVGEELRERYLAAGIGSADRFRVIRSPIELSAFEAVRSWPAARRESERAAMDVPGEEPVVLIVCALEPRKRVGLIIEHLAPRLRRGWRVLIAGDGLERPELDRLVGALGLHAQVRFLGQQEDVAALMGAADVLVHAAEAEGVPQVVIQALAAGLPVVATDVTGLREVPSAPVAVASLDGRDLLALASRAVEARPAAVPSEALQPWEPTTVEGQIARLHADMGLESW